MYSLELFLSASQGAGIVKSLNPNEISVTSFWLVDV